LARTSTHRQVGGGGGGRRNRQEHCKIIKGEREGGEIGRNTARSSSQGGGRGDLPGRAYRVTVLFLETSPEIE